MKRTVIAMVLIVTLLVACNSTPGPGSYPQDGGNSYPAPNSGSSNGNTPYPGPGNSGDRQANPNGANTGSPYPDPLQSIPGEENMKRGNVFIEESGIVMLESMPPQYVLHIVGNLPTPCHKLRARLSQPDEKNQIQVEVYSLVNPDEICTQVLSPFDSNISLGSYKTGKYSVLLNGQKVAEIDAP